MTQINFLNGMRETVAEANARREREAMWQRIKRLYQHPAKPLTRWFQIGRTHRWRLEFEWQRLQMGISVTMTDDYEIHTWTCLVPTLPIHLVRDVSGEARS